MIERVWNHLKPQISEYFEESPYTPEELHIFLQNQHHWTESPLFEKKQIFHFEHARFNLTQLCNMVELLTGSDDVFAEGLRKKIVGLVGYEEEARRIEQQQILHYEYEKANEEVYAYGNAN